MSFYILHSKQVIINFNGYHCHWLSVMYQVMLKIKMLHTSIPPLSDKRKCPISDSEVSSSIKVVVVVNVFTTEDFFRKGQGYREIFSRCIHGINLKIPGDFLLELYTRFSENLTSDLEVGVTEIFNRWNQLETPTFCSFVLCF